MDRIEKRPSSTAALIIVTLSSFLTPFMSSAVNVSLPSIADDFNIDVIVLSWITTAFILTCVAFLMPFGKLADIHGRKIIFTIGSMIFLIGSVSCTLSGSATMLLISRGIQGIGASGMAATALAILVSEFPYRERGKVIGINAAATYLGLSLGPFLGGLITQYLNWRSIFIIAAASGLLIIIITFWKLKDIEDGKTGGKFDLPGSILYMFGLVFFMLGVTLLSKNRVLSIVFIIIGITAVLLLLWWENITRHPLLNLSLFRHNRTFAFSNLAALTQYSGNYTVTLLMSLYLQYVRGFDPQTAGLILITNPAIQTFFSPLAGRLSDKIEPRIMSSLGIAITTLGVGMLAFITDTTSLFYIIPSLAILGFGFALFSSPNMNAIMSSVEKRYYGIASATMATTRQIGMTLAMAIMTLVFNLIIGQVEITPEYYPSLVTSIHVILTISAGLCVIGFFTSLVRGNIHQDNTGMQELN